VIINTATWRNSYMLECFDSRWMTADCWLLTFINRRETFRELALLEVQTHHRQLKTFPDVSCTYSTSSNVPLLKIYYETKICVWYMIYFLTAIGLSPGSSSTVHIYTQTVHRTTQNKQYIEEQQFDIEKQQFEHRRTTIWT